MCRPASWWRVCRGAFKNLKRKLRVRSPGDTQRPNSADDFQTFLHSSCSPLGALGSLSTGPQRSQISPRACDLLHTHRASPPLTRSLGRAPERRWLLRGRESNAELLEMTQELGAGDLAATIRQLGHGHLLLPLGRVVSEGRSLRRSLSLQYVPVSAGTGDRDQLTVLEGVGVPGKEPVSSWFTAD